MENYTFLVRKYLLLFSVLLFSSITFSQDFNVQHLERDVPRTGATSSITAVSSLNNAFVLNNNNRLAQAGRSDETAYNAPGRDLSGAIRLTATNTVTYYRESNSVNSDTKFNASVWEYTGSPGGNNEFIVRGRYIVNLNGDTSGTNGVTQALTGVSNANKCIPFITGVVSNVSSAGADSGSVIAYLENATTMRVQKGSNANNVSVYITLVEFTGSNWTILHGDSGGVSSNTGNITLRTNSDGTGTATNVSDWSESLIFTHHRGNMSDNGVDQAIADNWPIMRPGGDNQTVSWTFDGNHGAQSNGNRHFVHVANNSDLSVTRFSGDTSNTSGETTIDISSTSLNSVNDALIVGTSISSGGGTAYGRGWRNYYFNSTTQAAHWAHRSGNTMSHEIQIINLNTSLSCTSTVSTFPYDEGFEGGNTGAWIQNTSDDFNWTNTSGGTASGGTGPSSANGGSRYLYTETSNPRTTGDTAILESPCFDLTSAFSADFSFYYHMYGSSMGTLYVELSTDNGATWPDLLWSQSGQVQTSNADAWLQENIDLSSYIGNTVMIRFRGVTGTSYTGDMAIDDISLTVSTTPQPEINLVGNGTTINNNDNIPSLADDTDFGSIGTGGTVDHTFTIENTGTATLNLTGGTPLVDISGDAAFTILTQPSGSTIATSSSLTFVVRFAPTIGGTVTADISIDNNDSDENPYTFRVQGTGVAPLTEGPGGVTNDLALWLKGTDGLSYTSGDPVALWADQGRGANATVNTSGQEPTYYDNPTRNVNFNPVVEFDNTYSSFYLDSDFSYDDTSTQFLEGSSGLYTQEMFVVLIPDDTEINDSFGFMDTFCGDANISADETDATGIGMGDFTGRVCNESIAFALGTYSTGGSCPNRDGYAVYDQNTTYDNVGIINARNNVAVTQQELYYNANDIEYAQNDVVEFLNVSDSRYWIGRSEGWEATLNARMCEIITFSARKNDTDLTQERNRIQSYLAIKYGITLGANGTSQDYVDSAGNVIWDVDTGTPAEDVFNYDIAGIGRDDDSDLLQKQSRSVNNALDGATRGQGVLTIGIGSIANTNNLNSSTDLEDKEYLVWGNNGVDLDDPSVDVEVNMSTDISPSLTTNVQFYGIARTWKVVENVGPGGDIPSVEVAVLTSAIRTATPPDGRYLMFISDTPNFDPTADYRVMTTGTNELGEAIVKTNYDFDGTKYITFGWAPERVFERSIYFNGATNYVDMEDALDLNPTEFTISAWVMADTNSNNKSILSKRDASFTEGYDFKINSSGKFEVSWKRASGSIQTVTTNATIPKNEWHHLAITYGSSLAKIYIDGVLDKQINRTAPEDNDHSFFIGAASKLSPQSFFHGNIDEVRIWDARLTEDQIRYIMNQEIENNAGFVGASYFIAQGATPTKDEVGSIPWSDLKGYYPMSTYTYTNTKDESGNGNQGALRTLRTVDRQTAPLPYQSVNNGDWDTNSVWANGNIQTKPGANSIVDNTVTVDWNIIETNHNITMDNSSLAAGNNGNRNVLALFVESNELTVDGDNSTDSGYGLTISHFLNLDGKIDLEGESQLIQTTDSDLVLGASGVLEKDQQGTQDLYTYNYWSSPVGFTATGTPHNYKYTLNNNILKDGTTSSSPVNITFVGGYDGSNGGSNIEIAHYWIWKFNNRLSDDYASWQHVRNTGEILAGEGFTMKGVNDTSGNVSDEQNYVFQGKPNNGKVSLGINTGNEYLVGNPYASAIDAEQFITDNGPTIDGGVDPMVDDPLISGTLYFWEHWGGGSHILAEYQGGYGTYNFSGGAPAAAWGTPDPDVAQVGTGTKTPGRYVPVGQGFFVLAEDDGNIEFNNGQRVFQKEGSASSVFMRDSGTASRTNNDVDNRMKIRLGFNSVNTIHRQLLVTVDERASENYDWGFDAKLNLDQMDDMYWMISDEKYTVQGIDNISDNTILPIGIHTNDDGLNRITIDILENVPSDLSIYAHDKELNIYQDLRERDYEIFLEAGEYLDRFEITFTNQSLSIDEFEEADALQVFYVNSMSSIVIQNPKMIDLKSAEIFNMLGQSITKFNDIETKNYLELKTNKLNTGTYIINLKTVDGAIITKKVLVK